MMSLETNIKYAHMLSILGSMKDENNQNTKWIYYNAGLVTTNPGKTGKTALYIDPNSLS